MDYDNNEEKKRFAAAAQALYKTFNKAPDKDVTKILFYALAHLAIDDAEQCVTQAMLTCEKFPTPAELKRCVSLIPRRDVPKLQYSPKGNQKHTDTASKLIDRIMEGKLSNAQIIEACGAMEVAFPDAGWRSTQLFFIQRDRLNAEG